MKNRKSRHSFAVSLFALLLALVMILPLAPQAYALDSAQVRSAASWRTGSTSNPFRYAYEGNIVYFGSYEQDNNTRNGLESIAWRVLWRDKDFALVISEYGLDCMPFHHDYRAITWARSDLRVWLNYEFLPYAFTADEQKLIATGATSADYNPKYKTDPGYETDDKLFVLSINEALALFPEERDRRCYPTDYAVARGCKVNKEFGTCWWWCRTPGCDNFYVTDVRPVGEINYVGSDADRGYLCVRPAMWISLS